MVAHSASQAGGFTPVDPPRVAVAADGTIATVCEASRVTLLELPSGAAFAEIGVDPDAMACEAAWLGASPRLLVVSRYPTYSTAHLLDPNGPRTLAEIRLEAPMRLFATVGATALAVGPVGAVVLTATETHLMPHQFPTRTVPAAAGAAGGHLLVALPSSIEEWDPETRIPRRRLRLSRAATITAVGGSERLVWMTTQQEPARIDVIPLVNRGQPRAHDLPEPIASIVGHPRSDVVACIGARTGRLYVVDLDGRSRLRVLRPPGIEWVESAALAVGRMTGIIVAQALHPVAILPLDSREADVALLDESPPADPPLAEPLPADPADALESGDAAAQEAASALDPAAAPDALPELATATPGDPAAAPIPLLDEVDEVDEETTSMRPSPPPLPPPLPPPPRSAPPTPGPAARPAAVPAMAQLRAPGTGQRPAASAQRDVASASERFSAWRDLARQNQAHADPLALGPRAAGAAARGDSRASWRDEIVTWTRAIAAGAVDYRVPGAPPIDDVIARFELAPALHPALVLLYGAHLCGERGVAPADVARILDRQWDEALGRGELAERGVAVYAGSRVALSALVLRALDELPPVTGALLGEPGASALLGPCLAVAGDEPLAAVAERCLARIGGAILIADGDSDLGALVFEARARGAAPMLRARLAGMPTAPAIFVIDDPDLAEQLGLPRLA